MKHHSETLDISGTSIFTQSWTTPDAKANIFVIHGYGEHSGRYEDAAERLTKAGYNVFTYDRRGSGRSGGVQALIVGFDVVLDDLKEVIERTQMPQLPTFLLGHSLGGLIGSIFLGTSSSKDFKGAVLTATAIKIDESISPFLRSISGFMGALFPNLKTVKLNTKDLSKDKEIVTKYENDPFVYHQGTKARTGANIIKAMKKVQTQLHKITIPILILHGGADRIADPVSSQMLFDGVSSSDRTLKIYEGLYHEIMNEPEKDMVFYDIIGWLDDRLSI